MESRTTGCGVGTALLTCEEHSRSRVPAVRARFVIPRWKEVEYAPRASWSPVRAWHCATRFGLLAESPDIAGKQSQEFQPDE